VEPEAAPVEARVTIRDAGVKGKGAFAMEPLRAGTWVSRYVGDLLDDVAIKERYEDPSAAAYLLELNDDLCLDAQNSSHFSRYFNHAEFGNLETRFSDVDPHRIDFFASRDIDAGEELTFDYGPGYWRYRGQPDGDSRNFSDPIYRERSPELSILFPPPVGTVLPLVPLNALELKAALALPVPECRAALLRCLDFFGAANRTVDGELEVRVGVKADAEHIVYGGEDEASVSLASLERAASSCIVQAVLDPADPSGAASHEFESWRLSMTSELELMRGWRARVPRFASTRHDAVGLAAFLLWKSPATHEVHLTFTRDECNALISAVDGDGQAPPLESVLMALEQHASEEHVRGLVTMLQQWYDIGDGCTVVSDGGVPALAGTVPWHLKSVWQRVPRLVKAGLLQYHYDANSR